MTSSFDPVGDRAIVETGKVLEAVRRHGVYSSVVFDDPVTQAVIVRTYGGWPQLCAACDAEGFRREFSRTWMAYFRQGIKLFGHLPGTFEITNRNNGYHEHIPPPILTGDQDKARAVLRTKQETTTSKPTLQPGTHSSARVEYYACREEVEAMIEEGYHVLATYEYMKKQGRVTCSYITFADYVRRGR